MSNLMSRLESPTLEYIVKTRTKYSQKFIITTIIDHLSRVSMKIVSHRKDFLKLLGCSIIIDISIFELSINPNKAGLFERSFS